MQRNQLHVPFELKDLDEATGTFSGYAAIFNNVDLGHDVILPGAFKEIVRNKRGKVRVLWQHIEKMPIGVADVTQDDRGLKFQGGLVMEDPQARVALAHMKAGSVDEMSFGYEVLPDGQEFTEGGVRRLTGLKLWEISPVTFGMNPATVIDSAKSAGVTNIRDFENFLCEAGFSRTQAKALACGGWKKLQNQCEADSAASKLAQLVDAVSAFRV